MLSLSRRFWMKNSISSETSYLKCGQLRDAYCIRISFWRHVLSSPLLIALSLRSAAINSIVSRFILASLQFLRHSRSRKHRSSCFHESTSHRQARQIKAPGLYIHTGTILAIFNQSVRVCQTYSSIIAFGENWWEIVARGILCFRNCNVAATAKYERKRSVTRNGMSFPLAPIKLIHPYIYTFFIK